MIRITATDVKKIVPQGEWVRYRSRWGTVRATRLADDLEIELDGGVLSGSVDDYIVIDETSLDCWIESSCSFRGKYIEINRNKQSKSKQP